MIQEFFYFTISFSKMGFIPKLDKLLNTVYAESKAGLNPI